MATTYNQDQDKLTGLHSDKKVFYNDFMLSLPVGCPRFVYPQYPLAVHQDTSAYSLGDLDENSIGSKTQTLMTLDKNALQSSYY